MGLFGNNDRLNTARYNLEQYEKRSLQTTRASIRARSRM